MFTDEPLLNTRLAPKGAGGGLAATIPSGMRAVAIPVNDIAGVAGFVVPGMHVDILISGRPPGAASAESGTLTKTLLQNIGVLSAGQNIQKDSEGKPVSVPVVNVLVTPQQAEVLSLASSETRIQLVLRNPLDTQDAKTEGVAMSSLFPGAQPKQPPPSPRASPRPKLAAAPQAALPVPAPAPAAEPTGFIIEVLHGSKRAKAEFKGNVE